MKEPLDIEPPFATTNAIAGSDLWCWIHSLGSVLILYVIHLGFIQISMDDVF